MFRLTTAQRQSLPENIREHLTALYAEVSILLKKLNNFLIAAQNDNLAKQVRGLKAKNNELIREHIEMVKDKNIYGIQLQNQKLDIKRLTSLQSIHAARSAAETSTSKAQLDERARTSLSIPGEAAAAVNLPAAAERRMSSFFAITQLSDELARVAIRSPNIENIQPSRGPQVYDTHSLNKRTSTTAGLQSVEDIGSKLEKLQDGEFLSGGCEAPTSVTEDGVKIGKAKSQPSKIPVRSAQIEGSVPKHFVMPHSDSADAAAQGKSSRQRSQVNYKEARFFIRSVKFWLC